MHLHVRHLHSPWLRAPPAHLRGGEYRAVAIGVREGPWGGALVRVLRAVARRRRPPGGHGGLQVD